MQFAMPTPRHTPQRPEIIEAVKTSVVLSIIGANEAMVPITIQKERRVVLLLLLLVLRLPMKAEKIIPIKWMLHNIRIVL